MKELTSEDFHYVYSKRVSDFLSFKGVRYITKGINPINKKLYSMYQKTQKLQDALEEYNKLNQN